jgi:hypothetical protein
MASAAVQNTSRGFHRRGELKRARERLTSPILAARRATFRFPDIGPSAVEWHDGGKPRKGFHRAGRPVACASFVERTDLSSPERIPLMGFEGRADAYALIGKKS